MSISIDFGNHNNSQVPVLKTYNELNNLETLYVRPENLMQLIIFLEDIRTMPTTEYSSIMQSLFDLAYIHKVIETPIKYVSSKEKRS